ncbi:MAG: peroxide stress protein YaaA [Pseudomonadota bacterium]
MILLLSPAKTLDYDTPPHVAATDDPGFLSQSAELIRLLKKHSADDIANLMNLSPALAELNAGRYKAWRRTFTDANSKPAVLAFNGDVYEGLDAASLKPAELAWAQSHVAILSGLYGVLRPLDRMQPYRLEMGTALPNPRGNTLYAFWGDTLAEHLNDRLAHERHPCIVNLASQEYFKAVSRKALKASVVECVFEDWKPAGYKVISFFAKRARGLMARYAIQHRVKQPEALQAFDSEGYAFTPQASQAQRWVFRRRLN